MALALDIFGDGKVAHDPKEVQELTAPFYAHPGKAKARIDAAIAQLKKYPQVDTNNIGADNASWKEMTTFFKEALK